MFVRRYFAALPLSILPYSPLACSGCKPGSELWVGSKMASDLLWRLLCETRHRLTSRESEIVNLLEEGLENHEIGERLFISPQKVRWHLRSIYSKLGTHDRIMATMCARFLADVRPGRHRVSQNGKVAVAGLTTR